MDELYHEMMGEIYLTRTMLFLAMTATTCVICEHPLDKVLGATNAVIAVLYFVLFVIENRRADQ